MSSGPTISEQFGSILSALSSSSKRVGAVKMGTTGLSYDVTRRASTFAGKPVGGASLLVTLDKRQLAKAVGRMEAYKHIPYKRGKAVFTEVGQYMTGPSGPIERAFRQEQTPAGRDWSPLTPATLRWRAFKNYDSGPILTASGELRDAATDFDRVVDIVVTGKYARMVLSGENWSGKLRYKFYTHQLGTYHIPPRPFMPVDTDDLSRADKDKIRSTISKALLGAMRV